MFAHAGQWCAYVEGSDGGALATPGGGAGACGVDACGRRPIREFQNKKPATDFSVRALQISRDDGVMPVICPTCQTVFERSTNCRTIRRNGFDKLKPLWPIVCVK